MLVVIAQTKEQLRTLTEATNRLSLQEKNNINDGLIRLEYTKKQIEEEKRNAETLMLLLQSGKNE